MAKDLLYAAAEAAAWLDREGTRVKAKLMALEARGDIETTYNILLGQGGEE